MSNLYPTESNNNSKIAIEQAAPSALVEISSVFLEALKRSELDLIPYRLDNKPNDEIKFCKIDSDEIHALSFQNLSGGMAEKLRKLLDFSKPLEIRHFEWNDKHTLVYFVRAPVHEINIFINALESEYCVNTSFGSPVDKPNDESPYCLSDDCKKDFADGESKIEIYELAQFEKLLSSDFTIVNDAKIFGTPSKEVKDLEIAVSFGDDQRAKVFKGATGSFQLLMENYFFKHQLGNKDGKCIVFGDLIDKRRIKTEVRLNSAIGLDIDSGESIEETFEKLRELGITTLIYTTHSHNKSGIEIKKDAYLKWADKEGKPSKPTTENVREYLKNQGKYVDRIIDKCEFIKTDHITGGVKLLVDTPKIEKFRVIIPLKSPYVYSEQVMAHQEAIFQWEKIVSGVGAALGIKIDRATRDPSRLFYLPRHPKGGDFQVLLNYGTLLDWNDVTQVDPRQEVSGDPFAQAGSALGGGGGKRPISPNGIDLKTWAAKFAEGFQIATLFQDQIADKVRFEQSEGKLTVECPFDENHSNSGDPEDPGCYVKNPEADGETFIFKCSHDGCHGKDRLDMLEKAMKDGWFSDTLLEDPLYDNIDRTGEVEAEEAAYQAAYEAAKTAAKELSLEGPFADVTKILKSCVALEKGDVSTVINKISKRRNAYAIADIRSEWKRILDESKADEGINDEFTPLVTLDEHGQFVFSKQSRYKHGKGPDHTDWIILKSMDDDGQSNKPIMQNCWIESSAIDEDDVDARYTIAFRNLFTEKIIRKSFPKLDFKPNGGLSEWLLSANFACDWDNSKDRILGFFANLTLPADTLIIDRGWNKKVGSFMKPDGDYILLDGPEMGESREVLAEIPKKLMNKELAKGEWKKGTYQRQLEVTNELCRDGKNGREGFLFCLLAGASGIVKSFVEPHGYIWINLNGTSSKGKTSSLIINQSVAGGGINSLNATAAYAEAFMRTRTGVSISLDEGEQAKPDVLKQICWMASGGVGKGRSDLKIEEREITKFGGAMLTSAELTLREILKSAGMDPKIGHDVRIIEVNQASSGVLSNSEAAELKPLIDELEKEHFGHFALPVAKEVAKRERRELFKEIDQYAAELAGEDESGVVSPIRKRAAMTLAYVRAGGLMLIEAGILNCDVEDIDENIRWAWASRVDNLAIDPVKMACERLASYFTANKGGRIRDMDNTPEDGFQEAYGYHYNKIGQDELFIVAKGKLAGICDVTGYTEKNIVSDMIDKGIIEVASDRNYWRQLPDSGGEFNSYRIKADQLRKFSRG